MESIPKPEVLDPDRVLRDDREGMSAAEHRSQAQLLDAALHQSCAYADQLWTALDAVRHYLYSSVPAPAAPVPALTVASHPGQTQDRAWQEWIDTSAAVTSVLCGPHGDSGFGRERAEQEAQRRRTPAPTLADVTAPPLPEQTQQVREAAERRRLKATAPTQTEDRRRSPARMVATAVLVALAMRGLRPRRRATTGLAL